MADFSDLLDSKTLFDVSLPGAHDSMTSSLSTTVADNANDLPQFLSDLLHNVLDPNSTDAHWLRNQSVTQILDMAGLLKAGIRFIDFRIVWTKGKDGKFDWFCLHELQTNVTAMTLLRDLKAFLDSHLSEVVVLWVTKHSDSCADFKGADVKEQQTLFNDMVALFGSLLFDHQLQRLNETVFATMWKTNQRLVLSVANWKEMTNESSLALDACQSMNIWDPPVGVMNQALTQQRQVAQMRNSSVIRKQMQAENRLWATFWSTSTPTIQLISSALTTLFPMSSEHRGELLNLCAKSFHIPNSTFCPATLLEVTSLGNYYLQRVIEFGLNNSLQMPMIVYGDHIGDDGSVVIDSGKTFAFVPAILVSLFSKDPNCGDRCTWLQNKIEVQLINDPTRGRLKDWPPLI